MAWPSVILTLFLSVAAAQEAVGQETVSPVGLVQSTSYLATGTGIPFYDFHGQCNTVVQCAGLGSATVKTITTELPGITPSVTTLTITPTTVRVGVVNTVYIVLPGTEIGRATITSTLTAGATLTETIEATPPPGAPATHWVFPGGPEPTNIVTVTSYLPMGHGGHGDIWIGPNMYVPGITPTITYIPPVTSQIEVSISSQCPAQCERPQATVTVTKEAVPAPFINVTQPDGTVEAKPASKFPCSDNDLKPCRGSQIQGWTVFKCLFGGSRKMDGSTYPNPWTRSINFNEDVILTVSDSWYQAEHWTITLDGTKLGETHEDGFKNNAISCSADGDSCIAKGFSHGSFWIPKGSHSLDIAWTDGPLTYSGGWKWTHGYGVYRFDRPCKCGDVKRDEL